MQDRAIAEIGKIQFDHNPNLEPFELYVEEIFPNKVCKMILAVFELSSNREILKYKGVDNTNVNELNYQKFAYRKGSSRGGDVTFTTKFGNLDKKLKTLIEIQLPEIIKYSKNISSDDNNLFLNMLKVFMENLEIIQHDMQEQFDGLERKDKMLCAFSVVFQEGENRIHLSDIISIRKKVEQNAIESNYIKYGVSSKGKNSNCSICYQEKAIIYGFGSPFKYSTVDKPGTVSGFFNQKNNWINYPICERCALELELGKNYVTKNLSNYFYGKNYFLIPKTILPNDSINLVEALSYFEKFKYNIKNKKGIESREDYLMSKIGEIDNFFSICLMFFEENPTTKAIKIKLMLEEILPSRFKMLFIDIPNKINKHPLYVDIDYDFRNKQKRDLKFSFGLIKQFFDDNFYEIIYKIFTGKKLSKTVLYEKFNFNLRMNYHKRINNEFSERGELTIAKAHMVMSYLNELKIIN